MNGLVEKFEKQFAEFFASREVKDDVLFIQSGDLQGKLTVNSLLALCLVKKVEYDKVDVDAPEPTSPISSDGYALKVYF